MSTLDNIDKRHLQVGLRKNRIGTKIFNMLNDGEESGMPASASLLFANQPVATDTIDIGADVYEFVTAAGNVTNDANIAVVILGSAALTLAALVLAVNATYAPNEHPTINNIADDAPALANGTEAVVADVIGTTMRIRSASVAGGSLVAADPSIVLAEAITDAADIWDVGDVNLNTLAGRAQDNKRTSVAAVAITAAMITNTVRIDFPFTPVRFVAQVRTSAGVVRVPAADAFVIGDGGIVVTFGGGVAPDMQATDILTLQAWS